MKEVVRAGYIPDSDTRDLSQADGLRATRQRIIEFTHIRREKKRGMREFQRLHSFRLILADAEGGAGVKSNLSNGVRLK